ncbi:rhomboid family protein [Blumeria hordei DH14]|uniref:Rhomboid family protein n=1 Tax=Blumeria graminis f. sp. hordei (strain DH14) TaxID=546991 RepID=N1J6A4_BLUG1|nr:rhomboid family protein [Blumeria hordei DH14]
MNKPWFRFLQNFSSITPVTCRKLYRDHGLTGRLRTQFIQSFSPSSLQLYQRRSLIHDKYQKSVPSTLDFCVFVDGTRKYTSKRKRKHIIKNFDDLPPDFKESDGLSYRETPLTQSETREIFGNNIDTSTADRVLRGLHGRRVSGTLEDPLYSNTFEKNIVSKALVWLRKNVPVDEDLNAGLRAEKELAEMEINLVENAERVGLYKPNARPGENLYGESAFDRIRKSNIQKREAENIETDKFSQADEVQMNSGLQEASTLNSRVELRRPGEHPWLKYYTERANVLPDTPPVMTAWQRIWPSGLLVISVVAASLLFTQVYTQPTKSARLWPEIPISAATIIGIIIANTTVFCMWRIPMFWRFLNKNFIMFPGYPRPLSLLGCCWSHQTVSHILLNMTLLYILGTRLHEEIGRGNFLALYVSAGALSSFFSLSCWVFMQNFSSSSVGASGAVIAVITAYLLSHSSEKIKFFGVFPPDNWPSISALFLLGILLSFDLVALRRFHRTGQGLTVDHYGHLGGYASGATWAYFLHSTKEKRAIETTKSTAKSDKISI